MTDDERQAILAKAGAYTVEDYAREIPPKLLAALRAAPTFAERHLKRRNIQKARPGYDPSIPSKRELEVAHLVADGLTNKEIGARLFMSSWTVADYVSRLLTKLDLTRRVELAVAVARAQERAS